MSNEDEYELNFIKIDSNNNVKLIEGEDLELEMLDLMASVSPFETESIDGILLKYFKKIIPSSQDLLKINVDISKQYIKNLHSDKKNSVLCDSINRILSTDYKGKFIFNKTNIQDVSNILINSFNDIKKYKISSFAELQYVLQKIDFKKYNFKKLYLNNEYIKNRRSTLNHPSASTSISSNVIIKELYEESSEFDDFPKYVNRNVNKKRGITYIDNNSNNIMCSSYLTDDYNYDEEITAKKLLTKECFSFHKNNKDDSELPIELIILLYKLKDVNTLIYQINNVDEQFFKMAIFILLNVKWLFMHEIEEIKFDLGNEELQKGIIEVINERTKEIYYNFQKEKSAIYYNGSYKARTINLWEPEGDIFFESINNNQNDQKEFIYSEQPNIERCTFDNHLCNIYNEYGKLTNLKYIRPIIYTIKKIDNQYEQKFDVFEDVDNYLPLDQRAEKESIYLNSSSSNIPRNSVLNINSSTSNSNNNNNVVEKTTPSVLKDYVKVNIYPFQMVAAYSYFFIKEFKKLKKLNIYFHTPYSNEIHLILRMYDINYDRFHFLIFINKIDTLTEANFSFNSLDNKSFENILGIINKNSNLTSLKLSFFTSDINYFDNGLFNLWSSKKLSIRKLFFDQKESLISSIGDKEKEMNYFILHHNKFLDTFEKNLRTFFNLLKFKTINNLEELILRFDIPLTILNSEKYIILLVKFIINLIIMLTFQYNRIHTLKILAPDLPFDSFNIPYIRQLFNEIMLEREINDVKWEEKRKSEKKRRIKEKEKELKQLREKENELKEKNERKNLLQNYSSSYSSKDVAKIIDQKEPDNEELNIDVDDNLESFDYSKRFRSVFHKNKPSYIATEVARKETMSSENLLEEQRRKLNTNDTLENITIQFKIYNLPEIFNICLMNNLKGLKYINFGYLDQSTFISFLKDYKANSNKLVSLKSLKISLGVSVISYVDLEEYIFEYINVNTPVLEEKFLFSDLKIVYEAKMQELVELVYFKAVTPKLVIQIGNDNDNNHLLSKVMDQCINNRKMEMDSLLMIMDLPEYKKLYNSDIIKCIGSFCLKKENKVILCKENPYSTNY